MLDGFQFAGDLVLLRHKSAGIDLSVRFRSKGRFIFQASAVFKKNNEDGDGGCANCSTVGLI